MHGITLAEQAHAVNILPPIDINGGIVNSDVFSLGKHGHASILIQQGVVAAASTVTVEECDDFTPSNSTAIVFAYYSETTAAGDTLSTRTAATAAGFAMTTNNTTMYVIEVDGTQLSDGFPNLRVVFSDPGAGAIVTASAWLTGPRYAQESSATAIA